VAIKPPDFLNRIPSVSDLLEKPPIRALAERWNRSVVANGVKSFLEELRTDLQRRASEVSLPSIRDLAERAARYVISRQHHAMGVAINATGSLWGPVWTSPPLADAALERAFAMGREFALAPSSVENQASETEALLCRLSGAQAAAVVQSYSGAVWLALVALAADREVLVARADVGDVGPTDSLPNLAAAAKVTLIEVGTTNSSLATEYELAISPRATAILAVSPDSYRIVGHAAAELGELVALARDRELISIDALGTAPLLDRRSKISWPRRSAHTSIATGTDVVLLRGDGLVGGPPCGIIVGRNEIIRRITAHPLFGACKLDPLRCAALTATLECYENPIGGIESIPVWQSLSVSIDNLRNRAERLAPQLARAEGVASATPLETRSPIAAALPDGLPSYGIALSPTDGNVHALDKRLRSARLPILGRIEEGRIILDLRTVLPRQDTALVDGLAVRSAAEATI
jgi:L-seryl-tRNA(Ser) seleniumtransferase